MNIEAFKEYFKEGKIEEAQEVLEEFLSSAISEKEQASALITLAGLHMEAQNAANREYIKMLDSAILELSSLKKRQNQLGEAIMLDQARKKISEG